MLRPGGLLLVTVPANPYRYDWTDRWAGHRRRYDADGARGAHARGRLRRRRAVQGWGFPLTGLYHRQVYRRALRRRLEAGGGRAAGGPAAAAGRPGGARGPRDRLGLRRPPARATTACWPSRGAMARPAEAPGRRRRSRRAAPGGAGAASPPACWCSGSWAGRWSTGGRPSPRTTGTSSRACSSSASSCCWSSTSTSALGYGAIVDRLHHPGPPPLVTLSIWARSLLGRYVPGNVLMVLGRVVLSHERGVPRRVTLAATVYEQALSLGVAAAGAVIWIAAYEGERRRAPVAARAGAARAGAAAPAVLRARLHRGCCARRAASPCRACWPPGRSLGLLGWYAGIAVLGWARHLAAGALGRRGRGRRPGVRRARLPALVRRVDDRLRLPLGPRRARGGVRAGAGAERPGERGRRPVGRGAPGAHPGRARVHRRRRAPRGRRRR